MPSASHILILCLLAQVLIMACKPNDLTTTAQIQYFDLKVYIAELTADSQSVRVEKRVVIGDSDETKTLEDYELWKDEQSFENFNINLPALIDKYTVDTSRSNGIMTEEYHASDPELRVQEMKVVHQGNKVEDIMVKAHSKSFLENLDIELKWKPGSSYTYRKISDKIFSDLQEQSVSVRKLD